MFVNHILQVTPENITGGVRSGQRVLSIRCHHVGKSNVLETSISKVPLIFSLCVRWSHPIKTTHPDSQSLSFNFSFQKDSQYIHIVFFFLQTVRAQILQLRNTEPLFCCVVVFHVAVGLFTAQIRIYCLLTQPER